MGGWKMGITIRTRRFIYKLWDTSKYNSFELKGICCLSVIDFKNVVVDNKILTSVLVRSIKLFQSK